MQHDIALLPQHFIAALLHVSHFVHMKPSLYFAAAPLDTSPFLVSHFVHMKPSLYFAAAPLDTSPFLVSHFVHMKPSLYFVVAASCQDWTHHRSKNNLREHSQDDISLLLHGCE
eukprot:gnl/TRDRNA2_/TRDRNA2_151954_c0_seq1.p1 gnl/TRDRNA2_/TRDRNA2_151954_c0~~gnl/TRDRNA2_/TRDRNA2_151954_c0_seq1.p1  ORF type:complete len:114 (-),score=21.00 gnl/TRDRNA2_/TRDRNA2_151954_c0_seq1:296-637(-)